MNISELIERLEELKAEHGDDMLVTFSGMPYNAPEQTIHAIEYTSSGPLKTASELNEQDKLPERIFVELREWR